jgi:hypothetical protein
MVTTMMDPTVFSISPQPFLEISRDFFARSRSCVFGHGLKGKMVDFSWVLNVETIFGWRQQQSMGMRTCGSAEDSY